ncbi:histidine phosphatase family protein [Roseibium sp. CAU 1637]|uniref:Histidine phosphatase family protein n=1 Tax=Roseibium limicola TaxID=2816037 RepID=A0A939EQ26_9HYPH|nr:histidine phosphatase family protein [Roseibium limicola]MBO0346438.1 histidine phosphatase family protein [Roseibium limicola]
MSFCIYLTHPHVQIEPSVPIPHWGLSDKGRAHAETATDQSWAGAIRHVISSHERKAIETAEVFADAQGLSVRQVTAQHENDRSATGYLPMEEFEAVANQFFASPDTSIRGWETARAAQQRIVASVSDVLGTIPADDAVLFCGHGAVGTLLKCHLMNTPIDRCHDQSCGGNWYRFERKDLEEQASPPLPWTLL